MAWDINQPLQEGHEVLGDEDYCSGYLDPFGKWNNGFPCPVLVEGEPVFCCGTESLKYCCVRPRSPAQPQGPSSALLLGVIFGISITLVIIVAVSCFHCSCCIFYKKRQTATRGSVYQMYCPPSSLGISNMYSFSESTMSTAPRTTSRSSSSTSRSRQTFESETLCTPYDQGDLKRRNDPNFNATSTSSSNTRLESSYSDQSTSTLSEVTVREVCLTPKESSNDSFGLILKPQTNSPDLLMMHHSPQSKPTNIVQDSTSSSSMRNSITNSLPSPSSIDDYVKPPSLFIDIDDDSNIYAEIQMKSTIENNSQDTKDEKSSMDRQNEASNSDEVHYINLDGGDESIMDENLLISSKIKPVCSIESLISSPKDLLLDELPSAKLSTIENLCNNENLKSKSLFSNRSSKFSIPLDERDPFISLSRFDSPTESEENFYSDSIDRSIMNSTIEPSDASIDKTFTEDSSALPDVFSNNFCKMTSAPAENPFTSNIRNPPETLGSQNNEHDKMFSSAIESSSFGEPDEQKLIATQCEPNNQHTGNVQPFKTATVTNKSLKDKEPLDKSSIEAQANKITSDEGKIDLDLLQLTNISGSLVLPSGNKSSFLISDSLQSTDEVDCSSNSIDETLLDDSGIPIFAKMKVNTIDNCTNIVSDQSTKKSDSSTTVDDRKLTREKLSFDSLKDQISNSESPQNKQRDSNYEPFKNIQSDVSDFSINSSKMTNNNSSRPIVFSDSLKRNPDKSKPIANYESLRRVKTVRFDPQTSGSGINIDLLNVENPSLEQNHEQRIPVTNTGTLKRSCSSNLNTNSSSLPTEPIPTTSKRIPRYSLPSKSEDLGSDFPGTNSSFRRKRTSSSQSASGRLSTDKSPLYSNQSQNNPPDRYANHIYANTQGLIDPTRHLVLTHDNGLTSDLDPSSRPCNAAYIIRMHQPPAPEDKSYYSLTEF